MSDEEQERLVTMISNGNNTFAELDAAFPHIGEYEWRVSGRYSYSSQTLVICRSHDNMDVPLEDSDIFELTDEGKSLLYRMQKESQALLLTQKSIQASIEAANWAKIAVAVAIILYIVDVLRGR